MRQRYGIELSGIPPTHIDSLAGRRFDYVITLCKKARESSCPEFPAQSTLVHWNLPHPAAAEEQRHSTAPFLALAAALKTRVKYLLQALTAS